MVANKMNLTRSVLLPGDTKKKEITKIINSFLTEDGICAAQMNRGHCIEENAFRKVIKILPNRKNQAQAKERLLI